jgi:hypothetical protein
MAAPSLSRRFCQAAVALLALLAGGCAVNPAPAQVAALPPIPPGDARFWFYRVFFPDDSGEMPAIAMNGKDIGYALAGANFYRDVPAGRYHLSVVSLGWDYYQTADVAVAPGQQVYVKIASLPSWNSDARGAWRLGTYYVMVVSPQLASLELPATRYSSGE